MSVHRLVGLLILSVGLVACTATPTPTLDSQGYPPANPTLPAQGYPIQSQLPTPIPGTYPGPETPTQAAPTPAPTNTSSPKSSTSPEPPTSTPVSVPTEAPTLRPTPATAVITYEDFRILPGQTTMAVNTRVTFLIKSASGNFHEPYTNDPAPAFDSGPKLGDGASYVFVFSQPGTFTILCGYHNDMRATVVVTP